MVYTEYISILYLYMRKDITPENEGLSLWYQLETNIIICD
jgi:hypothetical protein